MKPSQMQHFVNRVVVCVGAENTSNKVLNNRKMNIEQIHFAKGIRKIQIDILHMGKYNSEHTPRKMQVGKVNSNKSEHTNRNIKIGN